MGDRPLHREGSREFAIDTLIVALTQLLLKARALVTLPLIVKMLGTASYGVFTQVLTFAQLAGALLNLNLHLPLVRFLAADLSRKASVYSTLMMATLAITGCGALLMIAFAGPIGGSLLDEVDVTPHLRLAAIAMLCANIRLLNMNVYRATGRLVHRSAVEIVATFGELAGVILLLSIGRSLLDLFLFMAVWQASIVVVQSIHVVAITRLEAPSSGIFRESLRYALPLLPASLSVWALDRIDRFVIGSLMGASAVGVYSANYALAGLLMLFLAPFQITLVPKVSALWDRDRAGAVRYIDVSTHVFLTLAIPFVVGAPLVAGPLLVRLGNAEIAAAAGWTTLLIAAGIMLWGVSVMQFMVFHGATRTGTVGAVTTATALVNLVLNLALVPTLGVIGAALATVIAYAVTCLALVKLGREHARLTFDGRYVARCVCAAAVMALPLALWRPSRGVEVVVAIALSPVLYFAMLRALRSALPARLVGLDWRAFLAGMARK